MAVYMYLLSAVVACYAALLYTRWRRLKMYWSQRGVPSHPPIPLLGNIHLLQKYNATILLKRAHSLYKSPYVGIWLFCKPALIVNCPQAAHRILIKDAANFKQRFVRSPANDAVGSKNIFTLQEPYWSMLRRKLSSLFTSTKIKNLYGLIKCKTNDLVLRINNDMSAKNQVNLKQLFSDYTTDIIGAVTLGAEGQATLTGESILRKFTLILLKFDLLRKLTWIVLFFDANIIDNYLWFLKAKAFPNSTIAFFRKIYRSVLNSKGGYEADITNPHSLLDTLRKLKQDQVLKNIEISEDMIIAQLIIFLQAGFDTTANALTFCMYELAFDQTIQDKLFKEVSEGRPVTGDDYLHTNDICNLSYLDSVINETLRKYSQLGWIDRMAARSYQVNENLTIHAGTPVLINSIGMRYDPLVYPEPDKFIPERFLTDDGLVKKSFGFLPFGAGPRNCIGQRFAMLNLRHAIASVILKYRLQPLPDSDPPSESHIARQGLFFTPEKQLYVQFLPRQ
ncbi:PREDICTED: cytochrome P450 6k1-like [Papilio xuthus]|uniref:unspecific monooxygenase n=1 Tax=Papilio xuthus TaxID=66420 RepID=A0AAJ6ZJI9_PAPXU|nr:PREDICTED: cytochrome P450 6k1-like [Papilio xuthus]